MKGYKGRLIHIDLEKESWKSIPLPEQILRKYIGGRGLGAKLYWDLLPPRTSPLDPENLFMVLTGPVSGTMIPCACKHVIVTKSPATGGWLESYSSGRIAAELKFAGYDGLILSGKAKAPTFVLIEDDEVRFLIAESFRGRGCFETESHLKEILHPDCGSLTIGPAGENLLKIACVSSEYFRKAGRGGSGAVLGSKNVKGIAVKGSGGIPCADIPAMHALVRKHVELYQKSPIAKARHLFGTPLTLNITHPAGMLPTRNFTRGQFDKAIGAIDKDGVARATVSHRACYGCPLACSRITLVKEGPFAGTRLEGPEYETLGMLGANLEIDHLPAVIKANYLCDDLGMDTVSAGSIIGFAMECYEKGLLTDMDTDGLKLDFGNHQAMLELLELMGRRKGFGALCSEGVSKMARRIGRGTEAFAMHSKGLEFPAYDARAGWGTAITYSTTPRGGCHRRAWPPMKEVLGGVDPFTTEGKAKMVIDMMNENHLLHSMIVCDFFGKMISLTVQDWIECLEVVTGHAFAPAELAESAIRIETLIRKINLREGLTLQEDILPGRMLEEPLPSGPPAGKIIGTKNFLKMRSEYYARRGWDESGVPTAETLALCGFEEDPQFEI
jgi:aldehyde:ferredoxin oxidoreductase